MLYRKFGKTNENVSILGFGCMRLPLLAGGDPTRIDEEMGFKLIHHAIDEGVNYIDTAYPYHGISRSEGGQSEIFVGKALKNGYREKVKLATKLPSWLLKTRQDMDKYLNEQLERLQTDYIDFYLVHGINRQVWPVLKELGFTEFLDTAIRDGRIKYAGFSFHDKLDLFKEVVDYYDWSFCQIQYNYLDENFQAGTEGLEYAAAKGLGITIMEPIRGGKLANHLPAEVTDLFKLKNPDRSPAAWALRWVWDRPEVSMVLSGMNAMDQLTDNLQTANEAEIHSLTSEEIETIDQVKAALKNRIKVNCTACGYCMPCPHGVDIPTCFAMYNNFHMFGVEEGYNMRLAPQQKADNCVECGLCEPNCPQEIPIPEILKDVKEVFK